MTFRHLSAHRALLAVFAIVAGLALVTFTASDAEAAPEKEAHLKSGPGSKVVPGTHTPKKVEQMIRAANEIRNKPYKWGGGHGSWNDGGYDCSGAVGYVLHEAGLLNSPLTSGGLMRYGRPGGGRFVKIFANPEHVYMVIDGMRFDTSYITDGDRTGPGWSEYKRSKKGFKTRHPAGL